MITLEKMTPEEFQLYLPHIELRYAQELSRNRDMSIDAAHERSKKETSEALFQGVDTPGHRLYIVHQEGSNEKVGVLWVIVNDIKKEAWLSDIEIAEEYRGKGFGRDVLLVMEAQLSKEGFHKIGLHVFGDNPTALNLYQSLGYQAISIQMRKLITDISKEEV
jgi:ribosomal protein S18 acetylase RimI-like enzyme